MCCASSCCAIHKSDCARTVAQTVNADVAALPVLKKLAAMACAASGRLMLLLVASLMLCGRGIVTLRYVRSGLVVTVVVTLPSAALVPLTVVVWLSC